MTETTKTEWRRRDEKINAARKKEWAENNKVKPANGGWPKLLPAAERKKFGLDRYSWPSLACDDHCTLWSNKETKEYWWLSQPYGITQNDARKLNEDAEKYGLEFMIDAWPSWHFPGRVLTIIWKRKR
jgi:hypothetical protein